MVQFSKRYLSTNYLNNIIIQNLSEEYDSTQSTFLDTSESEGKL
jgi:hypothetical protein